MALSTAVNSAPTLSTNESHLRNVTGIRVVLVVGRHPKANNLRLKKGITSHGLFFLNDCHWYQYVYINHGSTCSEGMDHPGEIHG